MKLFVLILIINTHGVPQKQPETMRFPALGECRSAAHYVVGDNRQFDPDRAIFFSPSNEAKAYCEPREVQP